MHLESCLVVLASLVSTTLGHGLVQGFVTDGVYNQGYILDYYYDRINKVPYPAVAGWYEEALDLGFVAPASYQTSDINCNKNAQAATISATVKAGGSVTFEWSLWPHNIGPVLTYVANCNGNCSLVNMNTLAWVKIDQSGYNVATSTWASQTLINNNNTWTTKVPSKLAAGNYVFRHEIIALHGGESLNGAQNYPNCINIAITGGGSDKPTGTLGTALYKETDPGILFNPYVTITSYPLPGPTLYSS